MPKKPVPKKPAPKKPAAKAKPAAKKKPVKAPSPKRDHRPQRADQFGLGDDDNRPVVVNLITNLDDRINNPDDIEVDDAAIAAGMTHGGMLETRAQELSVRGSGGRKRSGARTKGPGRDKSKRR